MPARARHAGWVAIVDGVVAGRGEGVLKWFSDSGSAFAGVSVRRAFRGRGIGASLWERVERHLDELRPDACDDDVRRDAEGVDVRACARLRRATRRGDVLRRSGDRRSRSRATHRFEVVPLRDVAPEEVYEVDMITTQDVPMTDAVNQMPYDEWLQAIWNRPTITLDGSFAAVADGRVVGFTILGGESRPRTLRSRSTRERCRRIATAESPNGVKRASLAWAAANGIRAAWTTNDETNAAMLAVNRRLGYTPRLRHVEYQR